MGVYARGDSRYWWIWLEGTKIRFSSKIPVGTGPARRSSKEDAQEIYRAAMGDLARGTFKLPTAKPTRTFRHHAEWYRDHVTVTHRTQARERSAIRHLVAAFGDTPLADLTSDQIEQWKLTRAQQVKQSTTNRELEVLKPLLASAVPTYMDTNPAAAVRKFRLRIPPVTILTPEAEDAILRVCSPAERAYILLGMDALLRQGDARRLRVEHDFGGHLLVVDPKVEPYKAYVSTRLRAALDALEPKGGYYFPRKYGGKWAPMNPNTAHLLFNAICERAGVPHGRKGGGITYHSLRHTGTTRAARVVKLTVVQRLGGWKSLKQLERYDHPEDPEMIRAVEAIGSRPAHGTADKAKKVRKSG